MSSLLGPNFELKTRSLPDLAPLMQLPVLSAGTDRRTSRIPKMTPVHLDLPFSNSFTRGGESSRLRPPTLSPCFERRGEQLPPARLFAVSSSATKKHNKPVFVSCLPQKVTTCLCYTNVVVDRLMD